MNIIHPDAIPYRCIRTDHDLKFNSLLNWMKCGEHTDLSDDKYIIQLVSQPNFDQNNKSIRYFKKDENTFIEVFTIDDYKKANSYKNFKTNKGVGHSNGMFYELNLYTNILEYSNHHTSTTNGLNYERNSSQDGSSIETKGTHWKYNNK